MGGVTRIHKESGRPIDRRIGRIVVGESLFKPEDILLNLLPKLDGILRKQAVRLFATEGRSGGKKWKALEPRYAKLKKRKYGRRKILVASGTLRKDVTQDTPAHFFRLVREGRKAIAEFGVTNPVAGYHVEGIKRKDGTIAIRNPQKKKPSDLEQLRVAVAAFIQVRVNRILRIQQGINSGRL